MKIHCSGIGGIGLSAYAAHMKSRGHHVTGSDKSRSEVTENLSGMGIVITEKQDGSGLESDTDVLVYSEAVPETSMERLKAKEMKIPQQSYFQALGQLAQGKTVIAVSGTHGKSSTTGMCAKVLIDAGLNPSVVIGTKTKDLEGTNWRSGDGDVWLVEACEYRKSFLHLRPTHIIITNIDGDHFDAYENMEEYTSAFAEFLSQLPEKGIVIGHGSEERTRKLVHEMKNRFVDADVQSLPDLSVPGIHMQQNAQLVLALADELKIQKNTTLESLKKYEGSWRRMERKGETVKGCIVIDDYAHHPTEIKATIAAMKKAYPERRLVCVFEPHTNDRVLKLWTDFTLAFTEADLVLVTAVYDARPDKDSTIADVSKFAAEIGKTSKVSCRPTGNVTRTKGAIETLSERNDVLLIMGAGRSTNLAASLVV